MTTDELDVYHAKRHFDRTPEPAGRVTPRGRKPRLRFFVQRHDARNLHYDFRLELNGVLKSWAVPKGPSQDPGDKRLAVHVEDHPVAYGSFEGTIPEGEYGAGTVEVWDQGHWRPEGDPEAGYAAGKLKFTLFGDRLHGGYTLVRMGGKAGAGGKNWLLLKDRDDARPVVAGSKAEAPGVQLATLVARPPTGPQWLHETKFDGYRIIAVKDRSGVRLVTRNGLDWTQRMAPLAAAVAALPVEEVVLDGELVALDAAGASHFQLLQGAFKDGSRTPLRYYAFDLLRRGNRSLTALPLEIRKEHLAALLGAAAKGSHGAGMIRFSDHQEGNGAAFFAAACQQGLEGIVSKDRDAPYEPGRSRRWLKTKCGHRQEFVIGGYTKPAGSRTGFGALLLGVYGDDGLTYCGKVGTGFDDETLKTLAATLGKARRKTSPFAVDPEPAERKGVRWVEPRLVCEARFAGWTADGRLRQAAFLGLRADKAAQETHAEAPAEEGPVVLTSPDRVVYPKQGHTKRDVMAYYEAVADYILPYIRQRPLSLLRCPTGVGSACFFQKHMRGDLPPELHAFPIMEVNSAGDYAVLDDAAGLYRLVQLGVLEIHPWPSRTTNIEHPDYLVFDLDPGEGIDRGTLAKAALAMRDALQAFGLRSFLKTTGGEGLHIIAPIRPQLTWPEAKAFTKAISQRLEREDPELYVSVATKAKRQRRIFVDYLRNTRGATSVAPYSTRARDGATVAMPLAWDELTARWDPAKFTIKSVPRILARRSADPWAEFYALDQAVESRFREALRNGR